MGKIAIVGGGLFGRIIGLHLNRDHEISVFDNNSVQSGLRAAGCLIKPSWIAKIPRREEALQLLHSLVELSVVDFTVMNLKLSQTDPVYVLNKIALIDRSRNQLDWNVATVDPRELESKFDYVLDCRGSWSPLSYPKYGVSYLINGVTPPAIRLWRPFTQLVKFNIAPKVIWAGDGTALKSWTPACEEICRERVLRFVGADNGGHVTSILGRRPYPVEKITTPCGIHRQGKLISVFGGGKNGSIAAGWAALEISDLLKD